MVVTNERALIIVKDQGAGIANVRGVAPETKQKLQAALDGLTIDMIGNFNPANVEQMPAFIGLVADATRLLTSNHKQGRNLANRLGQLSRGLQLIWNKANPSGLALLLELCEAVDDIADQFVGED